jgi:hypothetical protein
LRPITADVQRLRQEARDLTVLVQKLANHETVLKPLQGTAADLVLQKEEANRKADAAEVEAQHERRTMEVFDEVDAIMIASDRHNASIERIETALTRTASKVLAHAALKCRSTSTPPSYSRSYLSCRSPPAARRMQHHL